MSHHISQPWTNFLHAGLSFLGCPSLTSRPDTCYMSSHILQPWTNFCVQGCHCWIAQVQYQGQTRYIGIVDCKPFINIFCRIEHRLGLKFFHFPIFCSMLIEKLLACAAGAFGDSATFDGVLSRPLPSRLRHLLPLSRLGTYADSFPNPPSISTCFSLQLWPRYHFVLEIRGQQIAKI